MEGVLNNESALAGFISNNFSSILSVDNIYSYDFITNGDFANVKNKIQEIRKILDEERMQLIKMEIDIYNFI